MKLAIVDIETTGLESDKHEIIDIGCVLVDGDKVEEFEVKVWPLAISSADSEALKINGYNKDEWSEAFLLPNALQLLSQFVGTDRPHFMAYNVSFDWGFLTEAYKRTGIESPFHYSRLDLMTMVWDRKWNRTMVTSLKNTCKALDLPPEPAQHRALNGAKCAYEVYKKLLP